MIRIDLSGKIALVTGATGELGREMAKTLARAGADVVVHYNKNIKKAEEIVKTIDDYGVRAMCVQADVGDEKSVNKMKGIVEKEMGNPDIIVTNAVSQYEWTTILEQDIEDYESQFKSCVMQNVLMSKAFVPALIEKKWGRIIAINTECSMQCHKTQSAYVSGKKGMDAVLRVLAKEIGEHGITVNQIAPGWTMSENSTNPQVEFAKKIPLKRRGTDSEVANVVSFLASDLASYITGAFVPVCGGNVMPGI